jgi:hypothetical protein
LALWRTDAENARFFVDFQARKVRPPGFEMRTRYVDAPIVDFHVTFTFPGRTDALSPTTLPGAGVLGVTGVEGADATEAPIALRAVTVRV